MQCRSLLVVTFLRLRGSYKLHSSLRVIAPHRAACVLQQPWSETRLHVPQYRLLASHSGPTPTTSDCEQVA